MGHCVDLADRGPWGLTPPDPGGDETNLDELPPTIHIATGVLMAAFRIDAETALTRLLIRAMQRELFVFDMARLLVDRPDRVEELMDAERPPH